MASFAKNVEKLARKVFPFLSPPEVQHVKDRMLQLCKLAVGSDRFVAMLEEVSQYVTERAKLVRAAQPEHRRAFIAGKLVAFVRTSFPQLFLSCDSRWADVGGGNGTMLWELQQLLHRTGQPVYKEHYLCIETRSEWVETYAFDVPSVQYVFWREQEEGGAVFRGVSTASVDVVLCMVALHHMSNETVDLAIAEMRRIVKPGGIVLLKEHHLHSAQTHQLIECEHFLYHLADCAYRGTHVQARTFLSLHVANYKSCTEWEQLFAAHGLMLWGRRNRFLDGHFVEGSAANGPSQLYWDVYTVAT